MAILFIGQYGAAPNPYPSWTATGTTNGNPSGPICPNGSYLHTLTSNPGAAPVESSGGA